MSDPRSQRDIARRLEQTQVTERPGGVTGQTTFYATGTYTPTYFGLTAAGVTTYLLQEGEWTRIGRVLTVSGRINWSAATGTGQAAVSLPFASANAYRTTGSVFTDGVTFANSAPQMLIVPATQYFALFSPLTNAAPAAVNVEAAGLIIWSVAYLV